MFSISGTVCEIWAIKLCTTLTFAFRIGKGQIPNIRMLIYSPYATSYMMAIVMFELSAIFCDIITFALPD